MTRLVRSPVWAEHARFIIVVLFIGSTFLFGGASRVDVVSLMILQPLSVLCCAAFLLIPGPVRWDDVKVPLAFVAAIAIVMALQLIPLPPSIWANLPGHAQFAEIASGAGLLPSWRPLSLTPDLTLASLVGLITPVAAIVGFAALPEERTYRLLPVLLVAVGVSVLFGIGQITGGARSAFYLYAVTNDDVPVGLFSNRNHQAVLLSMAWPMLALWATLPHSGKYGGTRVWVAAASALLLVPMLVVTGSRTGVVVGLVGIAFAWWQWRQRARIASAISTRVSQVAKWGLPVAVFGVVGAFVAVSRDAAFQRLWDISIESDLRLQYLPMTVKISQDFFPTGSGFGSFDQIFRYYETYEMLNPRYFNHAHNDLVELIMTGGLPAAVLLICFLVWVVVKAIPAFRARGPSRAPAFARLGVAMLAVPLLASLADYPLRTPIMSVLCAIACCWLGANFDRKAPRS